MTTLPFPVGTERDALIGFLGRQREALIRKLDGLSEADLRKAPTDSSLTLLGLLKHNALWERRWFQIIAAGRTFPGEWPETELDTDEDFRLTDEDTLAHWLEYYRAQIAATEGVLADTDLDAPCALAGHTHRNLRWVALHMIEEIARHAGHADIIRETLDGARGM
ncbi:DinB family protein [Kitasatospora camelliae]|uniref:DinB family protein n=1 Tax=Kitasatospora camelliae TaxID=3156397 RepID=A0AAU8JSQ5_9ACTN